MILTRVAALCALALCCYGYGVVAKLLFYPRQRLNHSTIVALGLVVLAGIGGVLNASRAASQFSLSICVYLGLAISVLAFVDAARKAEWKLLGRDELSYGLYAAAIFGAAVFLAATLLPTAVFNPHDDFLSYLPRIVRMHQTGTIGGNPFELLGYTDFGLQPFFQALLFVWLPIEDSYAFDTIFCFALGLWLLVDIGRNNQCGNIRIILAICVYVGINPQIVNISSVYSSTALVLALIVAAKLLLDALRGGESRSHIARSAVPVGGILAVLVGLKLTTPLFLLPFCLAIFGYGLIANFRAGAIALMASFAGALATLGAWIVVHADKFNFQSWRPSTIALDPALTRYPSFANAFQSGTTLYGGTRAEYAVALVALLIAAIASAVSLARRHNVSVHLINLATAISAICAYVAAAGLIDDEAALRFAMPFLMAAVPLTILFVETGGAWKKSSDRGDLLHKAFAIATAACLVALVVVLSPYSAQRFSRALQTHTAVSFPVKDITPVARAFSRQEQTSLRQIQSKLPVQATIWAWVDTPFHFDFARNRVWHFNHDWFWAPWHPAVGTNAELRKDLASRDVDYIIVDRSSAFRPTLDLAHLRLSGVEWAEYRIVYQNTANLIESLVGFANPFDVIYADNRYVLIALKRAPKK